MSDQEKLDKLNTIFDNLKLNRNYEELLDFLDLNEKFLKNYWDIPTLKSQIKNILKIEEQL